MLKDTPADFVGSVGDSKPLLRHLLTGVGKEQISLLVGLFPGLTPLP
jgi:hypothetical protein